MRDPKDLQTSGVRELQKLLTNVDEKKLKENFALELRGVRQWTQGVMIERDFGTKFRHSAYPDYLYDGYILKDPTTGIEYDIVVVMDPSDYHLTIRYYDGGWNTLSSSFFTSANGQMPHIRWLGNDSKRRVFLYYGFANTIDDIPIMRQPIVILKRDAVKYFFTDATTGLVSISAGWSIERGGGGLIPAFKQDGSTSAPLDGNVSNAGTGTISGIGTVLTCNTPGSFAPVDFGTYIWWNDAVTGYPVNRQVVSINGDSLVVDAAIPSTLTNSGWSYIPVRSNINIDDTPSVNWLAIRAYTKEEWPVSYGQTITKTSMLRVFITAIYDDGTAESDPIYQGYFSDWPDGSVIPTIKTFQDISFMLRVTKASMNGRISGLRFYVAEKFKEDTTFGAWADAPTDYAMIYEMPFNSFDATNNVVWVDEGGGVYRAVVPHFNMIFVRQKQAGANSIYRNLNHAPSFVRKYLTPRYPDQAVRSDSPVVALDQDDKIVRLSNINGDSIGEEDNFPEAPVDNAGNKLKLVTTGFGQILGIALMSGNVRVFRSNQVETYDPQSDGHTEIPADVYAKRSIVVHPFGVSWAGKSGIYLMPNDGSAIMLINEDWKNKFDGTLKMSDGATSYITDAYRHAILGGFNYFDNSIWFQIEQNIDGGSIEYVSWRFYPKMNPPRWNNRVFNFPVGGKASWFSGKRADGTFTIGWQSGILKYPNLDDDHATSTNYEDSVTSAGVSQGKGISLVVIFNFGSLFNQFEQAVFWNTMIEYVGSSIGGAEQFQVDYYINDITTAIESKQFPIDGPGVERGFPLLGPVRRLKVKITLIGTLANIKNFTINEFLMSFVKQLTDTL